MTDGAERRFRFRSDWRIPAPAAAVFAVLENVEDYPAWWPQVREVIRDGPDSGRCRFRSFLPFELRVTATAARRDPAAGLLEVVLAGDLDGRVRWLLRPRPGGTAVRYEQDTALRKPGLRRLARPARPLLIANHALMMRAGRRGLRARLGVRAGSHLDEG
ncbi:SRPBCC family protein [Streptomyces sp. DSM 44917]|uniref:SRPBCC family protein n=1 Tax=Streptomyces boetiae TaxID=3075541 RepID=A0ABU2LB51_9ACTN|nr:SRPBCC family protein [Streptomyces sp. DSM 44917]MDT0308811.1 SRPBCC family protein [Streptomyces sp. DSM 44917]